MSTGPEEVYRVLVRPFAADEVKFKPAMVRGNRALAICYIDARCVMDRLDEAFGPDGWEDAYESLADGAVRCRLTCHFPGGRSVTRCDVGGESEQPDEGDREKAAHSDALKRAAVKYGIGRYLYSLPHQWVDYDPQRKQFAQTPQLPSWALPGPAPKPAPSPAPQPQPQPGKTPPPANGDELHKRLRAKDAHLAATGRCQLGSLLAFVTQAGVKAGHPADITQWPVEAFPFAYDAVREFEAKYPFPEGGGR